MPRTARVAFENAFFHVFNRGINRQKIFLDIADYQKFLKRLFELKIKKRFDHAIYAYVLMPNHFHLLIQAKKIPIAKIMTSLLTSYSMYFNQKYDQVGPVFQNRFKSKLCQRDSYFWGASRYIHLNPFEANLVSDLHEYPWSSYQELFGTSPLSIIDRDEVVRLIGTTQREKDAYHRFLLDGIAHIKELRDQYLFDRELEGDPRFSSLSQKKYLRRVVKLRK